MEKNFFKQENVVEEEQEEETTIINSQEDQEKYMKAVNNWLNDEWKQDKRAGPIKKIHDKEYLDKECSIK